MSRKRTKENVIENKEKSLQAIESHLNSLIEAGDEDSLKRADLLSFWLNDYINLIEGEKDFDTKQGVKYERGDVVKVTLGYNIDKEFGGLHYCVVIENNNNLGSGTITVVPLTSWHKNKSIHHNSVNLGTGIHSSLLKNYKRMIKDKEDELATVTSKILSIKKSKWRRFKMRKPLRKLEEKETLIKENLDKLNNSLRDTEKMTYGSVALVNQVTTVSKMRILEPRSPEDPLYGVSINEEKLRRLNQKLQELYLTQHTYEIVT